jgi:hypothetical protein
MPAVHRRPDPTSFTALLTSWLAGAFAIPLALFTGATGQGLGTALAGGTWIGVCVPWDRQAWALVNQPALNFAALPSAAGYWLGSVVMPIAVATALMPLSLRVRTLAGQLTVVQGAWMTVVLGAAWQPFLDFGDCHLARWLAFRGLPEELQWLSVAAAAVAGVPIALRLVAIGRITRFHMTRWRRMALVLLHLLPPTAVWIVITLVIRNGVAVAACVAVGVPLVAVVGVAWYGYPAPLTHAVEGLRARAVASLIAAAVLAWTACVAAGQPLPGHRSAALQWGRDSTTNNIRDWMVPRRAPWLPDP